MSRRVAQIKFSDAFDSKDERDSQAGLYPVLVPVLCPVILITTPSSGEELSNR